MLLAGTFVLKKGVALSMTPIDKDGIFWLEFAGAAEQAWEPVDGDGSSAETAIAC